MVIITLDAVDYDVYESLENANIYLNGQILAEGWRAADDPTKKRALISSTRLIDRQLWKGAKTDEYQVHAFPRTGLIYPVGAEVPSQTVPQELIDAYFEIASIMVDGSDVQTNPVPGENMIQSLSAGSVSISYFRGLVGADSRFPRNIQELLFWWLAGADTSVGNVKSFGTCKKSSFKKDYDFSQGI